MFFLQVWGGNTAEAKTVYLGLEYKGNWWKLGQIGVLFLIFVESFKKSKTILN